MNVPTGIPPADIEIDEPALRALLRAQHPDLAELPLRLAATGWDNATYRLGEHLAVRLPRIEAAVPLIRKEQHWLPRLAPRLPAKVPVPVRVGEPGPGFPRPWSVVPWFAGRSGAEGDLASDEATQFGRFLAALHQPAPDGFPHNEYRGVPLSAVEERTRQRLQRISTVDGDLPDVSGHWRRALAASAGGASTQVHGDLHPKNVVVDDGRLAAVLDWGDLTAGDPAIDLGAAWMLFPTTAHDSIWAAYRPRPDTVARAAGWAVFFGVMLLDVGLSNDPPFARIGRQTLARLAATEPVR